jgi:hypothetical protein
MYSLNERIRFSPLELLANHVRLHSGLDTPPTTPLSAWFTKTFVRGTNHVDIFGFTLASSPRVCPLVHLSCSSVSQTATTTQHYSVWTSNGSPSSRATRLLSNVLRKFLTWISQYDRPNQVAAVAIGSIPTLLFLTTPPHLDPNTMRERPTFERSQH